MSRTWMFRPKWSADVSLSSGWVFAALLTLFLQSQQLAAIRYVAPSGSDMGNDCTNSAAPCATIQAAVDAFFQGEEIRVAEGTYTGTQLVTVDRSGTNYDYKQVVFIDKGLTLRGGYQVTDWTDPDPLSNPTIIDAGDDGRPITIVDTGSTVVSIEGFTLTGGDYTGLGNPSGLVNHVCRGQAEEDCGGGLYVYNSAFELRDSIVSGNVASTVDGDGGGIYLWSARAATIENTSIVDNTSVQGGGGLLVTNQYYPLTIRDSVIAGNSSGFGGGVCLSTNIEALIRLEDTVLSGNEAQIDTGGGLYARMTETGRILELERVTIKDNAAWGMGKGAHITAAGSSIPEAELINVLFSGNKSIDGAPVTSESAALSVTSNFTSLEAVLAHVTAAGNLVPTFLFSRPDTDPGRYVQVSGANLLLSGFENGFAAEESGSGEVTIEHTNTLFFDVTNQHLTIAGNPTFTAVDSVFGNPVLDGDYRLQWGSAAIDAGVDVGVTEDLDGDARPQGGAPDIGADEFDLVFGDGFETGNTSAWSETVP